MKVLKLNQAIFIRMGLSSVEDPEHSGERKTNIFWGVASFTSLFFTFVPAILFVSKYVTIDLESALYAAFPAAALFSLKIPLIMMLLSGCDLSTVFRKIQDFYNQKPSVFFEKADESSQKFTRCIVIYFVTYYCVSSTVMAGMPVLIEYLTSGSVDPEGLIVPYNFILPWDQHTFNGWLAGTFFGISTAVVYFFVNSALLSFLIGVTLYQIAFHQYFENLLKEIEHRGDDSFDNTEKLKNILCRATEHHILVKTIFVDTAAAFSALIFFQLFGGILFMATSILQLDMMFAHPNANISVVIIGVTVSTLNLLTFCWCGAITTTIFSEYVDRIYESHWFHLPVSLQKYIILMISNGQRPVIYQGFGMMILNLETFLKIIKTVMSYYLAFKTMTADA